MADPTPSFRPAGDPTADPPLGATRALAPGADGTVGQTPAEAAAAAEASGGPPLVPGFEVFGEIGRGGMGVVYRARQLALDRDVAIKVLRLHYPADAPATHRFLDEAHVTGQLQHPGVPPVHHVGALPDGRPYLVMKLIKGETLADLLARTPPAGPAGAGQPHSTGRLVSAFAQVCQAVAYAHSRRVIHRDLKPANIMVGKFGEVQVMDWGLAKLLRPDGPAPAPGGAGEEGAVVPHSELRVPRADETHAGSVLGTPAYMAPEQAGGEVEKVDERADVFGLGAILCVILTGAPPYTGTDPNELHLKAIRGQTGECFARLDGCGADPELVALCKRCLATEREARPREARAVADAVAGLLAAAEDRARQAELDRVRAEGELAVARVRAVEQRFKRRVQQAVGAVLALLLVVGLGFGRWYEGRRRAAEAADKDRADRARADRERRKAQAEREVTAALAEVNALCDRGDRETENPPQWRLTLAAARASLNRAVAAVSAGATITDVPPTALEEDIAPLRAAVAAAAERVKRDEFDCGTLELLESWLADSLRVDPQGRDPNRYERSAQQAVALLARAELPLTLPEAFVKALHQHRHRYQLTMLTLLGGNISRDERIVRCRKVVEQNAHPLQPVVRAALRTKTGVAEFLTGDGRGLTSTELVILWLTSVPRGARVGEQLLHEANRRNPADIVALAFLTETVADGFVAVGQDSGPLDLGPRPTVLLKHSQVRGIAAGMAAVAVRPDSPMLWSKFAEQLDEGGLPEWAANCYHRAIQLDPSRHVSYVGYARTLHKAGRDADSLAAYRVAIEKSRTLQPEVTYPELLVEAARAALILHDARPDEKPLTEEQRRILRFAARDWLREWLEQPVVYKEELHAVRTDAAFRFVQDITHLSKLPRDEATQWQKLSGDVYATRSNGGRRVEFVGDAIRLPSDVLPVAPPPRAK